ncbi:MAG TPA: histidine phosphatase family protein [Pseudonocardia sp.]
MTAPLLVLVRHGQTAANVAKALDSVPPGPPLNERGLVQARAAAERFAAEPVAAVYASTALRARQTAAPIAERHRLDVTVLEGVQEVFCGDLEGRDDPDARALFEEVYKAWADGDLTRPLPGGESAADLRARYLPAVAELWRRHGSAGSAGDGAAGSTGDPTGRRAEDRNGPRPQLVLASHGAAIRVAAGAMIGEWADTRPVPNAGRVVLAPLPGGDLGAGAWRLVSWDTDPPEPGDVTGGGDDWPGVP